MFGLLIRRINHANHGTWINIIYQYDVFHPLSLSLLIRPQWYHTILISGWWGSNLEHNL